MTLSRLDEDRLWQALQLAESAIGLSDPNPRVGCVLGDESGRILGSGFTQRWGDAHAEVMALRDAASQGLETQGATAWVTLEPCAHHGRTPPCCDTLIDAGISRVVVAVTDPFPAVNGAGLARLRAAGLSVHTAGGAIQAAARDLNIGFFSRVERGKPWIRLKMAMSLDGQAALSSGESQWITSLDARRDGHLWRKRASAVLTGIGTVLSDDPQLDVRHAETSCQPARAIVDSQGRTPPNAKVLAATANRFIFCAQGVQPRAVLAGKAEAIELPTTPKGLDLHALVRSLSDRSFNEVHIEAGPRLTTALLSAGLVDELLVYMAPMLLGHGRSAFQLPEAQGLPQSPSWEFTEQLRVGSDLRLRLRHL